MKHRKNIILPTILFALLIALGIIIYLRAELANRKVVVHTAVASASAQVFKDYTPPVEFTPVTTPVAEITETKDILAVPQPEQGRYGDYLLNADEIETLARLVKLEAGGECFAGQQAVAEVVLNRVLSPLYPNNVYDVIYQSGQFTPAGSIPYTTASQTQYDAVTAALAGPNILPQQVLYFAQGMNGRSEAWGWIGNHVFCY